VVILVYSSDIVLVFVFEKDWLLKYFTIHRNHYKVVSAKNKPY